MTPRPLLETVARAICRASGADPDQPVYRNGNPDSGVLYLKWSLYRAEAKAAIETSPAKEMVKDLRLAKTRLEIMLGRAKGCHEETGRHGVTLVEAPAWIEHMEELFERLEGLP
jgi:hypothetical protein